MESWIHDKLSLEQREPLTRNTRNANIFAVAGSGKTRTMVYMIMNDLAEGVPPSEIIAFTFTEKAADELLTRIHITAKEHLGDIDLAGLSVGTIHNWCFEYLLEQNDFYNFEPIDELHADALISRIYDQIDLKEAYGLPFPKAVMPFLNDVEIFYNENLDIQDVPKEKREAVQSYIDLIRRNRILPFGAMIRHATEHLDEVGPLDDLSRLYVDEYQDVNPAQVELIQNMHPDSGELVAVGDDMQCIYQWRGSDVKRILEFDDDFLDSETFTMETNYRSRPEILETANEISNNMADINAEKSLEPDRDPTPANTVNWLSYASEEQQAIGIADIIAEYVNNGVDESDIAVLIRKHQFGRPIVEEIESRGINVDSPALRRGEDFINEFVKPVFNWLSQEHQDPRNKVEQKELEQEVQVFESSVEPWIDSSLDYPLNKFWDKLNNWEDSIEQQTNEAYNIRTQLYDLLDACGIHIDKSDTDLMMGIAITSQIIRSVEEVHRRRLDSDNRRTPRSVMKEIHLAIDRNQDDFGETEEIDIPSVGVSVNTVHQAKGLEWPVVIIPSMNSGDFPIRNQSHGTSYPDEIAGRYGTNIEDERRLFYVAATRAEDRLFLTDTSSSTDDNRSPYIEELQNEIGDSPVDINQIDQNSWDQDWDSDTDDTTPELAGLSDLLLYIECPYQYGLRRKANIQPAVGDELGYGDGLHELIQRRAESDSEWDDEERSQRVDEHVHLPYMSAPMEENSQKGIEKRIQTLEDLGVLDRESETELPVEIVFRNGIVHGEIDYIEHSEDGLVIRDWKSNLNHEDLLSRYERQLQFYVHVLRHDGYDVSKAVLVDVGATNKSDELVTHKIDITDQAVSRVVGQIEEAIDGIQEHQFEPTPSETACSSCDMERLCPYSEAPDQ